MITPRSVSKERFNGVGMADDIENGYLKRTKKVRLDIITDQWVPSSWSKGDVEEATKL